MCSIPSALHVLEERGHTGKEPSTMACAELDLAAVLPTCLKQADDGTENWLQHGRL